jgi:hypothetical protein
MGSVVVSECPGEVWEAAVVVGILHDLYAALPEKISYCQVTLGGEGQREVTFEEEAGSGPPVETVVR